MTPIKKLAVDLLKLTLGDIPAKKADEIVAIVISLLEME